MRIHSINLCPEHVLATSDVRRPGGMRGLLSSDWLNWLGIKLVPISVMSVVPR